ITYFLVPLLKDKTELTQRQFIVERMKTAFLWAKEAVKWAEQTFEGSKRGAEKYEAVKKFIKEKAPWLDDETMKVIIESAVCEMNKITEKFLK
ncbi:MAG: phage holin, LLH family, partial [Eubacteriales bacterium]|nr:phage holin, LLH family [Eubacteriales bacterium]